MIPIDSYYTLGRMADTRELFRLLDQQMTEHIAVLGSTGSGKSRLLNQLVREHIDQGIGIAVIEPGDLCNDILAYYGRKVVETGTKHILKRMHCLRSSPGQCFRYDPFRLELPTPVLPELRDAVRRSLVHAKIQSISEVFQAKATGVSDFEAQPRLQRILTDVLYCAAPLVDGKRLSVPDAKIMLDLGHPEHERVWHRLKYHLPRDVVGDFEVLHQCRRIEDLRRETESTVNRFRALFSPLLAATLSGTGQEPSVDLYRIIQRGECLLVPVQEDVFFSKDQKLALSLLILHDIIETLVVTPYERRKRFTIVIDEAGEFLSDGLLRSLGMLRKHLGRLVLAGQNLSTFTKSEKLDLTPKLLSQAGTVICFNQKWPEDTDVLARVLFSGNLDFTPLIHDVERHAGYKWHQVRETSRSRKEEFGTSESKGRQRSHSTTQQHGESSGRTQGSTHGNSGQSNHSAAESTNARGQNVGKQISDGTGSGWSNSENTADSVGQSSSQGNSDTEGESDTKGTSRSWGTTEGESQKLVPLAQIVREKQKTGQMEMALNDQLEQYRQKLSTLLKRHAIVKLPDRAEAFEIVTIDVPDPFFNKQAQAKAVEWIKRELYALHPYYFTPNLSPEEEDRRISAFLSGDELPALPRTRTLIDQPANQENPFAK